MGHGQSQIPKEGHGREVILFRRMLVFVWKLQVNKLFA